MDDDEFTLTLHGNDIDPLAVADAIVAMDKLIKSLGGTMKLVGRAVTEDDN